MASEKITMPQLGESVTEGTITGWLVSVGDKVNKYDPLVEVQTDKVNAEVPSSYAGIVQEIVAKDGETIGVGELICYIEVEEEQVDDKEETVQDNLNIKDTSIKDSDEQSAKNRFSPAVLRIAEDNNIDLSQVKGSGRGGRITRKDLLSIVTSKESKQQDKGDQIVSSQILHQLKEAPKSMESNEASVIETGDVEVPISGVRKAIATKMIQSKQEAAHAWTMIEVDVTKLVAFRDSIKDEFKKKEGHAITYFAFFVKAVSQALSEFPMVNSMWGGDKIIQKKDINISIAVATDEALFVPVIKHADEKSIKGIAREVYQLASKVRKGTITSEEMSGGTFTVNNTGSFGSVQSMGIINFPQAAIIQVESIVKRPVVIDNNMIAIRDMINLCFSFDHRIIDGLVCGRFLARVKEILENMSAETTSIY